MDKLMQQLLTAKQLYQLMVTQHKRNGELEALLLDHLLQLEEKLIAALSK